MSLTLSENSKQGVIVLSPSGRIDHATADTFQTALLSAVETGSPVLVDMEGVTYISSLGLRCFMIAAKKKRAGIGCVNLTEDVAEIFKISRFDMVVPCHETLESGLSALTS